MKESTKNYYISIFSILAIIVIVILCIGSLVVVQKLNGEIDNIKNKLVLLENRKFHEQTPNAEYENTIAFLQSEMTRHREFIERQSEFITRLVAAIGSLAIFALTFLGLSNKKDIENTIQEKYTECIKEEFDKKINKLIGGEDKVKYLQEAVEKQKKSREQKITLLLQGNEPNVNEAIQNAVEQLKNQYGKLNMKYIDYIIKLNAMSIDEQLKQILDECDILVYEVNKIETKEGNKDNKIVNENLPYTIVCKLSKDLKKHCILYTPGSLDIDIINDTAYTSMAKTSATLIERLYTVLNL